MFSLRSFPQLRRLRHAVSFIVLAISFAGYTSLPAAPLHSERKALEKALHRDLEDYSCDRSAIEHFSTLSLAVSFRGDPEEIKMAVGTTRYHDGDEATPENLFQIGSNTKAFTSSIILRMEAEHVLSIEDNLEKWLPQYPAWGKVRIRQLLNMTSGIPSYDNTPAQEHDYAENPYIKTTPEQLVAYVYPTLSKPANWSYSNTNYILLEMIIEKASRWHSYQAELDRLIAINDLHNTFYDAYFYPHWVMERLVSGYYLNTDDKGLAKLLGKDTKDFSMGWAQGAGGIVSTPADTTRWVRHLFEGDVLPPKQRKELMTLVEIPSGEPIKETSAKHPEAFGLGVFQLTMQPLGRFWGYQGAGLGSRAVYAYLPESGVIITIFVNSRTSDAENKLNTVLVATLYNTLKKFGKV